MSEADVANMLAVANAQAGSVAVASVNADGEVDKSAIAPNTEPTGVKPDEDGIIRGTKGKQPTPEEALALMDALEGKEVTPEGIVATPKEVVEEIIEPEEVDITKMSKQEQIAYLQKQLDEENGVITNPLEEVEKKATEAGVDLAEFERQYIENGELTEEHLASLKKAGFDQVAIDTYITTKVAQETQKASVAISDICGSQDNFNDMSAWMMTEGNLTENELAEYNKGVQGEHYKAYLGSMYARFAGTQRTVARTIRPQHTNQTVVKTQGYASTGEMMKAMQHPKYRNDINYRREVQRKTALMK